MPRRRQAQAKLSHASQSSVSERDARGGCNCSAKAKSTIETRPSAPGAKPSLSAPTSRCTARESLPGIWSCCRACASSCVETRPSPSASSAARTSSAEIRPKPVARRKRESRISAFVSAPWRKGLKPGAKSFALTSQEALLAELLLLAEAFFSFRASPSCLAFRTSSKQASHSWRRTTCLSATPLRLSILSWHCSICCWISFRLSRSFSI
mmetsp:Transcript_43146/g.91995  ORF Transcript_43146/g.91995 Transcript_43146/m.91995 type:complete len:210 (+) Transcript_43146:929-1558(+)